MKKTIFILSLFLLSFRAYSQDDYTAEDLKSLRDSGVISQYDYEILLSETLGKRIDGKYIYNLTVDRNSINKNYMVIMKEGMRYYPLFLFFKTIEFVNYQSDEKSIKFFLGKEIIPYEIFLSPDNNFIIQDENDIFLEESKFEEIFLSNIDINEDEYNIRMWTSFETPSQIKLHLDNVFDDQYYKENSGELFFTNTRRFFEPGYARFNFGAGIRKDKNSSDKNFKEEWYGTVEYQGPFLYGEFASSYDFKNHEIGDAYIKYPEIWKQHSFEGGTYKNSNSIRERGFSFKKERGYYLDGKRYVIRETVPIGSRVELLYLGFPIAVKKAEDGIVEFDNPEIRSERSYKLRIYTPEEKVYTIDINTASDYNQQNKGEIEYDIEMHEDYETGKNRFEGNIYYGVNETLTLGGGFLKEPEIEDDKVRYYEALRGEAVYSNFIKRNPYTIVFGGEKAVNEKYTAPRYSYDLTAQIDIKDLTLIGELRKKGKYYDSKDERRVAIEYNPVNYLQLDSEFIRQDYYDKGAENDYNLGVSFYGNVKDLLITAEATRYKNEGHEYGFNLYYTGLYYVNLKLNNDWINDGKDYETTFTIFNKNIWDTLDFDLEFNYSSENKDMFTFRMRIDYENWLKGNMMADKKGNQYYTVGIDRTVDLKNRKKSISSMSSSRVQVITFLDENNNNIFDSDEKPVDNVEVSIGKERGITDSLGKLILYDIPNNVLHQLKPKVRKPSYTTSVGKITVRGNSIGTIDVYIPLKQFVTVSGKLVIPEYLNLSEDKKIEFYEDIFVKISDKNETTLELSMLDDEGMFYVSDLLPGNSYHIEFQGVEKYKPFKASYFIEPETDKRGINKMVFRGEKYEKIH